MLQDTIYGAHALSASTFGPWVTAEWNATPFALAGTRPDGSIKPAWCGWAPGWVIPAHAKGSYWVASDNRIVTRTNGDGTSPLCPIAVSTSQRVILFESVVTGATSEPRFMRSGVNSLTTWTETALPGSAASGSALHDAVHVHGGIVLACGELDGAGRFWRSIDHGITWAISAALSFIPKRLLSIGPGQIYALTNAVAAEKIWRSTDSGVGWSEGVALGFDRIREAAYLESSGLFAFGTADGEVFTTSDPISTPGTLRHSSAAVYAMAGGSYGAVLVHASATYPMRSISHDGITWRPLGPTFEVGTTLVRAPETGQYCMVAANTPNHMVAFSGACPLPL